MCDFKNLLFIREKTNIGKKNMNNTNSKASIV